MSERNDYRILFDCHLGGSGFLVLESGTHIIMERTPDGICHLWPIVPLFPADLDMEQEALVNQDFDHFMETGVELAAPAMYCGSLNVAMRLPAGPNSAISYQDLGILSSIKEARLLLDNTQDSSGYP